MRCIYCITEEGLTSSDIISYALTGAKLKRSFVCKTHNSFTNNLYEKDFIKRLDPIRNKLGLTTRRGEPIQFIGDLIIEGKTICNVKLSEKESLYDAKKIMAGNDEEGNKVLLGTADKFVKMKKGTFSLINTNEVTIQTKFTDDDFIGYCALHTAAKIAYEWFCYINNIGEYNDKMKEIVNYLLLDSNKELVDIVYDKDYYSMIDAVSLEGTNSLLQYDDYDGYRYVIFDLWKVIAYRVRICKTSELSKRISDRVMIFEYHLDGSQCKSILGIRTVTGLKFDTKTPAEIKKVNFKYFINRLGALMCNQSITINSINQFCKHFMKQLKIYDCGQMDLVHLLKFEDNNIIANLIFLKMLNDGKELYDYSVDFKENLNRILNSDEGIIKINPEYKAKFVQELKNLDSNGKLSSTFHEEINTFKEIYNDSQK